MPPLAVHVLRFLVLAVFPLLATSGCVQTSKFASESRFASQYTGSLSPSSIAPQDKPFPRGLKRPALSPEKPFFIEFRARNALSYGHALVAFGRLDKEGNIPHKSNGDLKPGRIEITGLHPASDSTAVYGAGHVIPVLASTGPSDGDDEEAYLLARYRINLTPMEFYKAVALIHKRKLETKFWNGPVNSCVTYVREIAQDLGLKTPKTFQLPKAFVTSLAELND